MVYVFGFIIVVIFYIFKVGVKIDRKLVYKYIILYMWYLGVGEIGLKIKLWWGWWIVLNLIYINFIYKIFKVNWYFV